MLDSTIEEVTSEDLHDRNEVIVIASEDAEKSDELLNKIDEFIKANKDVTSMDESTRNQKYGELKAIWQELSEHINNIGFFFNINKKEYDFIKQYVLGKCIYDHQSVFMGHQLKDDFFRRAETYMKNGETIKITCNESVLLHHLISTGGLEVKGLTEKSYNFRNVIMAIGEVNKYYNQLDIASKRAGEEINDWVTGLEKAEEATKEEESK